MNRISGRLVLKETGAGIPDLLVVIQDLDPRTGPEEAIPTAAGLERGGGDRIGSVLTGPDGGFDLTYEDSEFQVRNGEERRPDLLIRVLAPEEPGLSEEARLLYASSAVRQNAGRFEQTLIRISSDRLSKAGIEIPSVLALEAEPAKGRVQRLKEARTRSGEIIDGALQVARERVDAHRRVFAGFSDKLKASLGASFSAIPAGVLQPDRLVGPGESAHAKNAATIQRNILDIVNSRDPRKRAPARGFITLTEAEAAHLQAQAGADGTVTEAAVKAVAAGNGDAGPVTFLQRSDLLPLCRAETRDSSECAAILADTPEPAPPPPAVTGDGVEAIHSSDIPRFVARLLNPLTAPEERLLSGLTPAATLESVGRSVQELAFQPSPADAPAFHDFNQLQIAFQHVWQELTDSGVLDLSADAYEAIVELGGDPNRPEYGATPPFEAIKAEANLALRSVRLAPPPGTKDGGDGGSGSDNASGGSVFDRLIGVVVKDRRGRTADPDPKVRLPALLGELEERLKEKYSFTIFAANAKERSVNFGILNTFRQVWTPLSYQAGPLVKSIPLAPKQSQKVTVTRKQIKKRHQKEVENNLRIIKEETSHTSRAEREIADRATAKTEFSYSNVATSGNQNVGSDTATTTFKQDASRSSDDIKKAFHEAVFRSAQEFKEEHNTEITTDTSEELDSTETTEISNPNDEISVTFLFYELQRRYRVHEKLFRVTPVVLVAQEVPAPHEIDQAWLIAHDWILRRAILDDSFLPTLATLSESAGAETALAQLEANVRQQRGIVSQLREELAIARRIAEVQNGLVNDAVGQQTGSSGLVGSLLGPVGSALGGAVGKVGDLLFGGSAADNQGNRDAITSSAEKAADTARDLAFRLEREVTALNSITETFAKALQSHHTHLTEIARLRVHVKENILHYMQAIWRNEPPDQRFFRLHNVPIPTLESQQKSFFVDFAHPVEAGTAQPHKSLARFGGRKARTFPTEAFCTLPPQLEFKPLCEVADLDNMLGFKGNYMLFPLLESNPLTDFMMDPYVDRATGELLDPADPAGWSLDEFSRYVCCLKDQLAAEEFSELKPRLQECHRAILTAPRREDDVLVVPTSSLFIASLPDDHTLIEKFKQEHRRTDVKEAQAKARERELENVRRAARLLEGEREDPNIDKRILINGNGHGVIPIPG